MSKDVYQVLPISVEHLKEYKKWRKTSSSFPGAIMIGLIELFINCNKIDNLNTMIQTVDLSSEEKVRKMKNILEESSKLKLPNQRLTNIFDALKQKDFYNLYAQAFLQEYIKRKHGSELQDSEIPQFILKFFRVQVIVLPSQYEYDIREKDFIIIYKSESTYYVVVREPGPQTYKCSHCNSEKEEGQIYKMKCNHHVCYVCLKKLTQSFPLTIRCASNHCPVVISKNDYLTILGNQSVDKQESKYVCSRCKNRYSEQLLLRLKNCSHLFCKDCLKQAFSVLPKGIGQICIEKSCSGVFDKGQLDAFLYKVDTKSQSSAAIQSAIRQLNTPKSQDILQCLECFKHYKKESIYISECHHEYCRNCCDKKIATEQSKFKCFSSKCQKYINVDDVQLYFYQKIRSQNISTCANCQQETKINEAYSTHCGHLICLDCVKVIHDTQRTPICCTCNTAIREDDLEEYCIQQQLTASQTVTHFEKEFQASCTFCNSPFSDYNLQQDLLCSKHILGTCCIIFPLNCPQCEIKSLVVERDKLRFQLAPQDDDVWKNIPETPKLHS